MQNELTVTLIQSNLSWENPVQNRLNFEKKIKTIKTPTDIILLPEMFTTGFTMNPESLSEPMNGESVKWMKALAKDTNAAITGSLIIKEDGSYLNRLCFVEPNGDVVYYNKRHTFTLAGEDKVYKAGSEKVIFFYKGWKICPQICYDLRFPVFARNVEDYDLLFYVANWPKPRISAWDALLKARAIENMSYTIGVNRVGFDANNYEYPGHSVVYDCLGNPLTDLKSFKEGISTVTLSKKHQNKYREKLQFLNDRDRFTLI